jgi:hypothetical protein
MTDESVAVHVVAPIPTDEVPTVAGGMGTTVVGIVPERVVGRNANRKRLTLCAVDVDVLISHERFLGNSNGVANAFILPKGLLMVITHNHDIWAAVSTGTDGRLSFLEEVTQ